MASTVPSQTSENESVEILRLKLALAEQQAKYDKERDERASSARERVAVSRPFYTSSILNDSHRTRSQKNAVLCQRRVVSPALPPCNTVTSQSRLRNYVVAMTVATKALESIVCRACIV